MELDVLQVKAAHGGRSKPIVMMLVDTEAVGIHVSERRRRLLTQVGKRRMLSFWMSATAAACTLNH